VSHAPPTRRQTARFPYTRRVTSLSLKGVPVVDAHMHPWSNDAVLGRDPDGFLDRITMMGMCLLSSGLVERVGEQHLREMTDATPLAQTMARRLAAYLDCDADRSALSAARHAAYSADPGGYLKGLWDDCGLAGLVCDEGYPQPPIDMAGFRAEAQVPVHRVFRIEPAITALRETSATYDELEDALAAACEEAAAADAVAFKTVLAYRTGLDVVETSAADARSAFARWRAAGWPETRTDAKRVRDRLLHRVFAVAKQTDRPVHIHCGGGDAEIVLAHARAQDLVPFLTAHLDQPVVLIHSGQPWLAEGAYVAQILPRVYLELSITMPWSSFALDQLLELLLGIAPTNKVLYGSDESSDPEVLWLSAHVGREALERVLRRGIKRGWVDRDQARRIGEGVLGGNVLRLHGLA
jgi:uncharacterized protein